MAKLIVGIDFGTSTTVVRYKLEGTNNILPVKDKNGTSDIIPSAIFRGDDKTTTYGHEALNDSGRDGNLFTNFKMGLLCSNESQKSEKQSQIEEFLCFVYERFSQATKGLNYSDLEVFVSYPAKWSDSFIDFMIKAVGKAGFGKKQPNGTVTYANIHGVIEPKAATYNMLHLHLNDFEQSKMLTEKKPMHVFMLDMGAGTTDVIIFRLKIDGSGYAEIDNLISYPSVDNTFLCGGREIDTMLSEYVKDYVRKQTKWEDLEDDFFTPSEAKFWKDQIVSDTLKKNASVRMPPQLEQALKVMPNGKNALKSFLLTRTLFETVTEGHWKNLYELISSAMDLYKSKFGVGPEDIDLLFLTGGHSKWYTVNNLFNGEGVCDYIGKDYIAGSSTEKALDFKKLREEPWRMFEDSLPHECVSMGLCLQDTAIKIGSVSANNVWIRVTIGDKVEEPVQIAQIGQVLPIQTAINPRASLHKGALERQSFKVSIELLTGTNLKDAQKAVLSQVVDNDEGRFFANLFLFTLFTGYDTTIEIPLNIGVTENNEIDINGVFLYGDGENIPTNDLDKLKDKDGNDVVISKDKLEYI